MAIKSPISTKPSTKTINSKYIPVGRVLPNNQSIPVGRELPNNQTSTSLTLQELITGVMRRAVKKRQRYKIVFLKCRVFPIFGDESSAINDVCLYLAGYQARQ